MSSILAVAAILAFVVFMIENLHPRFFYVVIVLVLAAALTGCGFDFTGWENEKPCLAPLGQQTIAATYEEVQACTGLANAPLPFVDQYVFVGPAGIYSHNSMRIVLNMSDVFDQTCGAVTQVLRHEYVHYVLDYNGFSWEENQAHQNELFGLCGFEAYGG